MVLVTSMMNLSLSATPLLAASKMPLSHSPLGTQLQTVAERGQQTLLFAQLRDRGIAVERFDALQDERVLRDPEIIGRLRHALHATLEAPQGQLKANRLVGLSNRAKFPWPEEVERHTKEPTRHSRWLLKPNDFDMRQELRHFARLRNKGKPQYPRSVKEYASWVAAIRRQQHLGRTISWHGGQSGSEQIFSYLNVRVLPVGETPESIRPELLGFQWLDSTRPLPGDLMTYTAAFFTNAAIVTQSTWDQRAAEVMVLGANSAYLTCPENIGAHRKYWRFINDRKPDILVTSGSRLDHLKTHPLRHAKQLQAIASGLDLGAKAFTILASTSGLALGEAAWQVDYRFANSDWAIVNYSIQGNNRQRRLVVAIRYFQAIKSDQLRFLSAMERALRQRAQEHGFYRLDIFYPLSTSEAMKRGLKRRHYTRQRFPNYGASPGKRITLTS